jgi:hypothetical protein
MYILIYKISMSFFEVPKVLHVGKMNNVTFEFQSKATTQSFQTQAVADLSPLKLSGFFHVKSVLTFKMTGNVGITLILRRVRVANRY